MTNVAGTENVLKMAVYSKAERVVFLSSVEIYGENRGDVERFQKSIAVILTAILFGLDIRREKERVKRCAKRIDRNMDWML